MPCGFSSPAPASPVRFWAYWLTRHGFSVTVVERAPTLRKTGGHAVDLFRPAMNISEKMGVLPRVEERATGTNRMTVYREVFGVPSGRTSPRSSAPPPTGTSRSCATT